MPEPNLHLLRGDDTYSAGLRIKAIIRSLGDDFDAAMNTTRIDGKTAPLDELRTAVSTLPFFGSSRLVILDSALAKTEKGSNSKFTSLLDSIPPSTQLILIVEDHQKWRRESGGSWSHNWETLTPSHWLVKWFTAHNNAEIVDLPLPQERNMGNWIVAEAKRQGGSIELDAAFELGQHTGNDTSIASQEIAKLLMFVDYKRKVTRADVLELVSVEGSADVFLMLDTLMDGKIKEAQALMHQLLDDSLPEVILGAMIHRFRQLILVREALDEHQDLKELVEKRVIFNNQVNNYTAAARRFSMQRLEQLYHRLQEIDLQAKTSQGDLATNLELLVLEIGNNF